MDIMETSLGSEIERISTQGIGAFPFIHAVVHTPVGDIEVFDIVNYDVMRDYLSQFADETTLTIMVPRGQYAFRMALNTDKLEITITRSSGEVLGSSSSGSATISNRYKLVLVNPIDATMVASSQKNIDEFTMDLTGFEAVEVQLFEPLIERFSMQTVGGIFRKTAVSEVVRNILVKASEFDELDQDYKAVAVDIVEPDDDTPREHIIIPHGTAAQDAIGYIQKKAGGIYSGSVAYFYQNDKWFVFPPFDYSRYNETQRQLVIYRVPQSRMPYIERTALVEGTMVSVIATGEFRVDNQIQNKKLATGNGTMYTDAATLFESGVEVRENKAISSRGKNNNEYVARHQSTGLNKLTMSSERITSNKLHQTSILAAKEGTEVQLVWQNANPDLLTPGMQTRLYFLREGVVREVQAVLIGVQVSMSNTGQGLINKHKQIHAALRLWVNPDEL